MLIIESVGQYLTDVRALNESKLDDLIVKAAEGDSGAFEQLHRKFVGPLTQVAKTKAKGAAKADVDDIVQETFLKFFTTELPKFAEKLKTKGVRATDLRGWLQRVVINAVIDANRKAARKGISHRRIGDDEPAAGEVAGGSEKHLGERAKKVVRAAYKRALAKAKLKPAERKFIMALFGHTEFKVPEHGDLTPAAKQAGLGKGKTDKQIGAIANKAKKKFLKFFCTDKELCDLLPSFKGERGRARDVTKKIPGLGGNICKDHACEEVEFLVGLLGEEYAGFDQGSAQDLVLSWIARNLPED